jgi:predicted nucleotidyltransferase
MIRPDPNMAMVELIAQALGPLREQLVFVGGCAAGLLLTDPAAGLARVTYDVDLLAEVTVLPGYHRLESEFSRLGFKRDMTKDAPICRWRFGEVEVDLMPTEDSVLGFANRWYPLVARTCRERVLPSGMTIRLISAPAFVATKFEAFSDRGQNDFLASHDLEDIINVLDGRPELVEEVGHAPDDLRGYLADRCHALLAQSAFHDALPGLIFPDESHATRMTILIERLRRIAEAG